MADTTATQPKTDTANQSGIMTILQPIMTFVQGNFTLVVIGFVAYMMFGQGKNKSKGRVTASRLSKKLYKKVTYVRGQRQQNMGGTPTTTLVIPSGKVQPNIKYA